MVCHALRLWDIFRTVTSWLDELMLHYFQHILMLVLLGLGKTKKRASYSIRISPQEYLCIAWISCTLMSQEQQLHGSSMFSSSAPGLWLHLGATSNQGWLGMADTAWWASVPIRSYFRGTTEKLRCQHMPCLCCWAFETLTGLWIRIFSLLPTQFLEYISQKCSYVCWGLWYRLGKKCQRTLKD